MKAGRIIAAAFCALLLAGQAPAEERLTVVLVGDTGFNGPRAQVSAAGGFKRGELVTVDAAMAGIAPWLKGDVVVANLETVVTDRNDIAARDKMFVFRTHPAHVRRLVAHGINVFSAANNHAMDFGGAGAGETLTHLREMEGLRAWPGLGRDDDEAMQPHLLEVKGARIAASSIGNGGVGLPAREAQAGMLHEARDFERVSARLAAEAADLRILSVHYGPEFEPKAGADDRARFRAALRHGAAIIAGHHHHVARGVELIDGKLIAYGLGNFLHLGTQDMRRFDICRDFGLLARVGLVKREEGYEVETVEAVPITSTHIAPEPLTGEAGRLRVEVLNHLGAKLGEDGLRFAPQADGSGLWCAAGATDKRCAGWQAPGASAREAEIAAACGKRVTRGSF
ncbi:CapA family protein [Parvibaculum sp.]|uniref:CapA family protein n=1 Tax=Parvibaculum sp. TaxID=2024848 RepID=UPI001B079473|nr:CapA family protein [Parvibaculum sp.]MBO6634394.1 CapA family protein [Parvibaculum sp.]MBO6680147.1 CapA family protein [Parvibaculum sp.]MBO6683862.1 CapA family protein [Parvibaculum sp.]MBO6904125.1 CapA family protein [Parvibaculum sp.]